MARYRALRPEIVRCPHLEDDWAAVAVRSPTLLEAVRQVLGPSIAVEHSFLVLKWPGKPFTVPWHQDGIDQCIELDPQRSVSAWLAITDAGHDSGCLRVIPGSQRLGYLPFEKEPEHQGRRGRGDQAAGFSTHGAIPVPVPAGGAVLMDSRLLHSSGPNRGSALRIGLNIRYVAPGGCLRRDPTSPSLAPISGTGW